METSSHRTIDAWIRGGIDRTQQTLRLMQIYDLQAEFLFDQYEPTNAYPGEAGMSFIQRVERWINSFDTDEDRWSAFFALRYFFFIGQEETNELYRCAVQHRLVPWVAELAELDIFSDDFSEKLDLELDHVWPCPITDSLRINSLLHRTGLEGKSLRPDWLSLKQFGDPSKIKEYVDRKGVKYLALFEDFSGSGQQCERAVKFALSAYPGPILLTPLVICSPGHELLQELASASGGRLQYAPVVVLSSDCLVRETQSNSEPASFASLRLAMEHGYEKGNFNLPGGAYGFDGVGSLVSTYSNCPNNSPPIFHARSETWPFPLFPRQRRVK